MWKDLLKQEWLLDVFKCGQYGIFINSFRLRVGAQGLLTVFFTWPYNRKGSYLLRKLFWFKVK